MGHPPDGRNSSPSTRSDRSVSGRGPFVLGGGRLLPILLLAAVASACAITFVLDLGFVTFKLAGVEGQVHATVKRDFSIQKGAEMVGMIAAKSGDQLSKPRIRIRPTAGGELVLNATFGTPAGLIAHCDALEAEIRANLVDPNLAANLTYRCGFVKAGIGIDLKQTDVADFLVDPPEDVKICAMAGGRAEDCIPTEGGGCAWNPDEMVVIVNPDCLRSGLDKSLSCVHGAEPSATLLVPYFEVALGEPGGLTTLIAIKNEGHECGVARITLWTDLGVPTLTFYVRLLQEDIQTINLRDVFNGKIPATDEQLFDPRCPLLDFDPCQPSDLAYSPSALDVAALRADHTGQPNPLTDDCAGIDRGDSVATGYVTVDMVTGCTYPPTVTTWQMFQPGPLLSRIVAKIDGETPGAELTEALADQNWLTGDVFYVNPDESFAQSDTAVHIPSDPSWFETGTYTFYGAMDGYDGSDARVPLSSRYSTRLIEGGVFDGGTRLLVWRDNRQAVPERFACGSHPSWYPLGVEAVRIVDEGSNELYSHRYAGAPLDFCAEADGRSGGVAFSCQVDPTAVGLPPTLFGGLTMDLSHGDGTIAQGWVSSTHSAFGRFSVGNSATRLDDLCQVWFPGSRAFP